MPYEAQEGSGALFANDKGDNPKRPDYRGDVMVGGVEYKLAGWVRQTQGGKKFLSLKAEPKEDRPPMQQHAEDAGFTPTAPSGGTPIEDEDIPF